MRWFAWCEPQTCLIPNYDLISQPVASTANPLYISYMFPTKCCVWFDEIKFQKFYNWLKNTGCWWNNILPQLNWIWSCSLTFYLGPWQIEFNQLLPTPNCYNNNTNFLLHIHLLIQYTVCTYTYTYVTIKPSWMLAALFPKIIIFITPERSEGVSLERYGVCDNMSMYVSKYVPHHAWTARQNFTIFYMYFGLCLKSVLSSVWASHALGAVLLLQAKLNLYS